VASSALPFAESYPMPQAQRMMAFELFALPQPSRMPGWFRVNRSTPRMVIIHEFLPPQ
jgi:hypothetical protein